ncbi:hypothetical protein AMK59_3933, partial [Oryctes borbonicus]
ICGQTLTDERLVTNESSDEPPEGYYAFIEAPNAEPPRVRPPPYTHASIECREDGVKAPHASPFNLCGDLNKGVIPRNPMGQNVLGLPYPFEIIRNMTLKYLSRTLPILKADETMPKVAQLQDESLAQNTITSYHANDRGKRSIAKNSTASLKDKSQLVVEKQGERQGKKFCDQGGVFCMLYKAINGESMTSSSQSTAQLPLERRDDAPVRYEGPPTPTSSSQSTAQLPLERRDDAPVRYEGPPTPCPAKVEYATPVFAKNYQGIWRYVVQIPYEGYFTQTVEVTRCLQSRCHYLDGGCLSSPRWSSLLVAEIFYPDTVLSNSDLGNPQRSPVSASQPPSVQDFQNYQQYLHKRAGLQAAPVVSTSTQKPSHCDGVDNLGCFQVRLYYDWFLIPGSCKCWRPDYFNKYVRRKNISADL